MVLLPSWTLILVGDGDEMLALKQLVNQLDLHKQVIFMGMVEPKELLELGKMAWIGINLLEKNSLSYYYSLANKTFDYIQARLPAIHSDFPEYRLLARENKCILLLEKMDSSLFVELIENTWKDYSLYESMLSDTEKAAATYIWEEEEKKLLAPFLIHFPLSSDILQ
jgi:glycosyltransferase involved in cell wall biosynthesis